MKKLFYTFLFVAAICSYNLSATTIAVDSGKNKIKAALLTATNGDVLVLKMGQTYTEDTLIINKKITIKGESFSALPALDNLPVIKRNKGGNGTSYALINLRNGCDLTMQCVAIDNNLGETMFRPDPKDTGAVGVYFRTISINVDHCRLYNVGNVANYTGLTSNMGNVFDIPADSLIIKRKCKTILKKCYFTNNLIYNIAGRGIYFKAFSGPSDAVVDNNTFANVGQQLTLPRFYKLTGESDPIITVSFSNNTCWKLSANTSTIKEFIGQWNGLSPIANADPNPPAMTYTIKDNIFAHQIVQNSSSTPNIYNVTPFSVDETNFKANIFNDCGEVYFNTSTAAGTGTGISKVDTDPQFADTTSNDFTLGNTDWVADNKASKGAPYWAAGWVDPATPTSISGTQITSLGVYPNPVSNNAILIFNLKNSSEVHIDIVNLEGQTLRSVMSASLSAGNQNISFEANQLKSGMYFFKISNNGNTQYTKFIKK